MKLPLVAILGFFGGCVLMGVLSTFEIDKVRVFSCALRLSLFPPCRPPSSMPLAVARFTPLGRFTAFRGHCATLGNEF